MIEIVKVHRSTVPLLWSRRRVCVCVCVCACVGVGVNRSTEAIRSM